MNPWVAGRIVEQMQIEARTRAHDDRVVHQAAQMREPRRERLGLAVARLGLRMAGRRAEPIALRRHGGSATLETSH